MKRVAMILATALFVVPFVRAGEPKQDKSVTGVVVMTEVTAADLAAAESGAPPKHVSAAEASGPPNRVYARPLAGACPGSTAAQSCGSSSCLSACPHQIGLLDKCDGRFINWLTYRPPTTGMGCCPAPQTCYPPIYTFFLDHCSGGHCPGACAAHPVNQSAAPPIAKPAPELTPKPAPELIPGPRN